MRRLSQIFSLALLLVFSSSLRAALVEDLYTVELPVADQTTALRLATFNEAFRLVIIKVSGSEAALKNPDFRRPLNNSSRYVLQFRYIVRKDEGGEAFDAGQLLLRVVFNQDLVENLMRENDIPIWGKERPSTLLLINFDVNKKSTLVSSETTPELVEELDQQAGTQGLPVLFPLLDLEDRMILGVRDIIDSNRDTIDQLAARYAPDAILSGQVTGRVGKGWSGKWRATFSEQAFTWSFEGASRQDVLKQAVAELARILAAEYALQSHKAFDQEILFSVDEVTRIDDHIKVLAYLQSLDAVELARPVLFNGENVTYRVKLRNSAEDLHRLISLGYVLEQLDLPQIDAGADDQTVMMSYRLIH